MLELAIVEPGARRVFCHDRALSIRRADAAAIK